VERNEKLTRAEARGESAAIARADALSSRIALRLATDRSGVLGLRAALALFAVSLIVLSLATLGAPLTLVLLPIIVAGAIVLRSLPRGARRALASVSPRLQTVSMRVSNR
jgi:hypothetical protein